MKVRTEKAVEGPQTRNLALYDLNGDGKLSKEEQVMAKYDVNGDGKYDKLEVRAIIQDLKNMTSMARHYKWIAAAASFVAVLLACVMFGVTFAANEASKESHVVGHVMTAPDGEPVAVDTVKSFAGIYDMPALPTNVLRELKDITLSVDMTEDPDTNAVVEMSVKVSSVWKPKGEKKTKLFVSTPEAHVVEIDAAMKKASLKMANGKVFPLVEFEEDKKIRGRGLRGRGLHERRELNMFSGALLTSGSFTMMASAGY